MPTVNSVRCRLEFTIYIGDHETSMQIAITKELAMMIIDASFVPETGISEFVNSMFIPLRPKALMELRNYIDGDQDQRYKGG